MSRNDPIKKILMVEDNSGDARLLREMFNDQGMSNTDLTIVESIGEAENYLAVHTVDIILLDLGLPDADGLSSVRRMCVVAPRVPLVVLTGMDDELLALEALQEGAQDYLVKGQIESPGLVRALRYAIERKRTEEKLQDSQQLLKLVINTLPQAIWWKDSELKYLGCNQALAEVAGFESPEQIVGLSDCDLSWTEEEADFYRECDRRVMQSGVSELDMVESMTQPNGKKAWISSNKVPLCNAAGEIIGILSMNTDITERKKAEESIRFQAHLLDVVEQAVIATDLDRTVTYWNRYAAKLYGWKADETVGRHVREVTMPETGIELADQIEAQLNAGKSWTGEFIVQNKNGTAFPAQINNSPIYDSKGNLIGVVGVSVDISERKRAEQQIIESEEKYRSIVETANEGILLNNLEGRTVFVNRQMPEMLGYTADEMVGRTIFDFIFEEDLAVTKQTIERRKKGIEETSEIRLRRKDGSEIIFLQKSSPTRNEAGEITAFLTMNTDITERKKAERELQYAEAKYRSLVESSPAVVYLAEPYLPYSPIYISPNISRFGYTAEEWFERPDLWMNIIHREDRDKVLRAMQDAFEREIETDLEYRIVTRDGAILWLHDKGRFVLDEQGNKTGWQGVMVEITETKSLEDQLRQAQKLESVGRLAGGIAHDFNNMLTAINGYSDLTLMKLTADDPMRRNLEEIKKAGLRSADLTHQLLAFSRQQILQPIVLDLNETIRETAKMLDRLIGEDIRLTTTLDPQIGLVKVDRGELWQIIMNLTVNARDAMPQGGQLTVETTNVFLDSNYAREHVGVLPADYVMLAVSDTGSGMSTEIKSQIFEPFFTTKEIGKGTGLGLATVYGIVKQSGGSIAVYSEESVGTTFKIYLPRVAEQAIRVEIKDTSLKLSNGAETILLVEDEEMVRHLTRQLLEECGYTVIEARNGVEALEIYQQGDYEFGLLMTDVIMPLMGGSELAEKLKAKLSGLKILFTSGYTDDAVVRHGVIEAETNFIQKPYTPEALASKIRAILDNSHKT